ncbi:outer membrane protein assembly factor BamB family protein [Chryseobacterium aurantiacum]|uniref:outer membrane protein assembly factor BamB family protein n=1 Tax=Chryseobacterium aurantiacum TaxID=2116499 RepID=UPI000D124891|nr:PQQ-binding-like beta-propeller repeat protein [Chryseobacterium aurantiacum]
MKKLILLISASIFLSCNKNSKTESSKVNHATLVVATEGQVFNFNLDENKIVWQYKSDIDSAGNRNLFAVDGQNIFMPFESGKLINFDINTGKIIWQQQIYGNGDQPLDMSNDENEEAKRLSSRMPLFMASPLVDGQNILMASTGQPSEINRAWLYNFNRANGTKNWLSELPTIYNYFAPVKYRNSYFVNSAVFLKKLSPQNGVNTSYGMFDGDVEIVGQPLQHNEVNQFDRPIYNPMYTDGNTLFIGSEAGTIYALKLDKDGNLPDGDISDPNNTFIKNPKVFKWIYKNEKLVAKRSHILFFEDGTLYTEMRISSNNESNLLAINAEDGNLEWGQILPPDVLNWTISNGKIIGNNMNTLFYIDTNGKNFTKVKIKDKPLSGIESIDATHFIYVTQKGIEIFDTQTQTAKLVIAKKFNDNEHNNLQIKYISK